MTELLQELYNSWNILEHIAKKNWFDIGKHFITDSILISQIIIERSNVQFKRIIPSLTFSLQWTLWNI